MARPWKIILIVAAIVVAGCIALYYINKSSYNPNPKYKMGQPLDSLNGVMVYYNGMVGHTDGRNKAPDGYNIGMKHQCVEFVKRYYYERLHHKMPDAYGNAKDFYEPALPDSSMNAKRGLMQYANGSKTMPKAEYLLIFDGHAGNPYGHVAIVAQADSHSVIIIQQNPGPFVNSRDTFGLQYNAGKWTISMQRTLGWLRMVDTVVAP